MSVSVIIPAYNAEGTIRDTLESLLAQTYTDWEAIVVDDGSNDGTVKIINDFVEQDERIRAISQANGGESAARNTGIVNARYEWLLFLDADDWISPIHLERLTGELIANPELDAVHCGSARVAPDGTLIVEKYLPPVGDLFPVLARRAAFNIHACIVRRALVDAVGRFDTSLKRLPDWDLWQRVARAGARFGAVREVLAFYRMRPDSVSLDAYQVLKDGLRVLKQGHSPDTRVPNPYPDHADGLLPEGVRTEEFYFLSWCAGLLLGSGKDARPLLEMVKGDNYPELYPNAVAECIFGAAALPTCQPPHAWEKLWHAVQQQVEEFLMALEEQSKAPDLARRALTELKKMILEHSPMWGGVIEQLDQSRARPEKERVDWQQVTERDRIIEAQRVNIEELEQISAALQEKQLRLEEGLNEPQEELRQGRAEHDEMTGSYEWRLGDLLLNRLRLRAPLLWVEQFWVAARQRLSIAKLAAESRLLDWRGKRHRILTTVCDTFPIYSQTFVYQELTQLIRQGFEVRLVYSKLDSRDYLHAQFGQLWKDKRRLCLNTKVHEKDFAHYQKRLPEKVESLIQKLCEASSLSRQDLLNHGNFLQAFSFTRMVDAYRPEYLHSYFFYDRSLMALVAGYLLNIPRGISCYADHLLKDYELKVVQLHLELCDIVIATSARIKQELLEIAPQTDPNRILVKPNGIDTDCFPNIQRREPAESAPFRLVSVCRIEPKKGLLDLVEAVSLLRQRGLQVEAHLVGTVDEWSQASRNYKGKLDRRITELNLWGTVHLEGRQNLDGVRRFLNIAHLFVAPFVETESGDKDGIPTALLEGMATSMPAVATDAGSITEVIEDGLDGILVAQRDPVALANAIETLLRDPERRAQMGREAADKVRRLYNAKTCESVFHDRVRTIAKARNSHGITMLDFRNFF